MKIFYHTDMDGKCSGAIVRKFYNGEGEYFLYNYGDFPFDSIEKDEKVILVDCSCDFEKLLDITKDIIWIDHHKTAIDKYKKLSLAGIRKDGIAACELCWKYFYPDDFTPTVVKYLGDYDVWKFEYGEDTNYLQTGIRLYDTSIESKMWEQWLDDNYRVEDEIEKGKIAIQYRNDYYRSVIKTSSFMAEFEGYKAICCNAACVSSQLFDSVEEDYDIMIPFNFNGKQWSLSLYTKKDINCGELAKIYGGGGHMKAAGFRCDKLPFKYIEKEQENKK